MKLILHLIGVVYQCNTDWELGIDIDVSFQAPGFAGNGPGGVGLCASAAAPHSETQAEHRPVVLRYEHAITEKTCTPEHEPEPD